MAISFLVLFAVPGCFSCNARIVPKNRAKVVEEYVVSANFDSRTNFPQLNDRGQPREIFREDDTGSPQEVEGNSPLGPPSFRGSRRGSGQQPGTFDHGGALEERDYLVHHHLPPVPQPPPPPPPPPVAFAPSLFAVGLITFLMLLNSLQTSLLILKSKGSILNPVSGVVGRRKRFTSESVGGFPEHREKSNGESARRRTAL